MPPESRRAALPARARPGDPTGRVAPQSVARRRGRRRCGTLPGMAMRVGHARTVRPEFAGGSRTGCGGSDRGEGDGAEHNCVLRFTKASGKAVKSFLQNPNAIRHNIPPFCTGNSLKA